MIIWGRKGRETVVSRGRFFCPRCNSEQLYERKNVAQYFTLYFIPLFKTRDLGEHIECTHCHQTYKLEVLDHKPLSTGQRLLIGVRQELASGIPVHITRGKLVAAGLSEEDAAKVVSAATGNTTITCPHCNFTYMAGVKRCSNCGEALTALPQS